MTNALTVSTPNRLAAAMAAMDKFAPSGGAFMKMNANTGAYTYGSDSKEIPHGSGLAVDVTSFSAGWICWKDDKVAEEKMYRIWDSEVPPSHESDLPDHGPFTTEEDGWQKQVSAQMRLLDAQDPEDSGAEMILKMSSYSGVVALKKLMKNCFAEMTVRGEDAVPIIEVGAEGFMPKEKKYGKKYAPVFTIVEWTTRAALEERYGTVKQDDPNNYVSAPVPVAAPAPVSAPAPAITTEKPVVVEAPGSRRRHF
jgi:hypothetical protein